jgi:hypothetical protein
MKLFFQYTVLVGLILVAIGLIGGAMSTSSEQNEAIEWATDDISGYWVNGAEEEAYKSGDHIYFIFFYETPKDGQVLVERDGALMWVYPEPDGEDDDK